MSWPRILQIPYHETSEGYYRLLADQEWPVWLDSGHPAGEAGRYDILTANPWRRLEHRRGQEDPWEALRQLLGQPAMQVPQVPLSGGAIGFISYDLADVVHPEKNYFPDWPEMVFGLYDWVLVQDHQELSAYLVCEGRAPDAEKVWQRLCTIFSSENIEVVQGVESAHAQISQPVSEQHYAEAFQRIQRYIRDGDCYQVNYAHPLVASSEASAMQLFQLIRQRNPSPYAALLEYPFGNVMSASPEQFLEVRSRKVRTRPIKGTIARGESPAADSMAKARLQGSDKDRAENLMIVDLMRNDLGKVCKTGSIRVEELFGLESFPTVHHLVSTVSGELADDQDAVSLLQACFPGGSITGAPKKRAMEIIAELEHARRGVYCGTVAWLSYQGDMDSNIAIRTLCQQADKLVYWAGGGIVADSDMSGEYQESLAKAAGFHCLFD